MKKIMIDLDDTIVDQSGWLYLVNNFLKTEYTIDDVKGYYIQDLVPDDKKEEFLKYFITENTYLYSNIYPNCVDVLKRLNEKYDIYICSAYVFRDLNSYSSNALKYKFDFLSKNFPFIDPNKFLFLTNKSLLDCDIKIDDKLNNLTGASMKLLFTAYHNKDDEITDDVIRVNNWIEIANLLDV